MVLLIQKSATPLPIHQLVAKNFIAADSKINSKTTLLPIQKSAAKNCITVISEINSDGGVISALLLSFFLGVYKKKLTSIRFRFIFLDLNLFFQETLRHQTTIIKLSQLIESVDI